jgi:hypothetical protein
MQPGSANQPPDAPQSTSEMKLDGNAIGGLLGEIFALEMTAAEGTCDGCGQVNAIGRVDVYMNAPGAVVRCPACGQVLMRIVHGPGRYWISMSGIRCLEFAEPAAS